MNGEIEKVLSQIRNPLIFASKNSFSNLEKIKSLEESLNEQIVKARAKKLPKEVEEVLYKISGYFKGYEKFDISKKKKIIVRTLKLIDEVNSRFYLEKTLDSSSNSLKLNKDLSKTEILKQPIRYIRGVGPKISSLFSKIDVHTIEDLLFYFPRGYEDRREIKKISDLTPGSKGTVVGSVVLCGKVKTRSASFLKVTITDGTANLNLIWFRFSEKYIRAIYKKGVNLIVNGEVAINDYDRSLQIIHPKPENIEIIDDEEIQNRDSIHFNRIVPIFPLTEGLKQRRVRGVIKYAVDNYADFLADFFLEFMLKRNSILPFSEAVKKVHFPDDRTGCVNFSESKSVYHSKPHKTVSFYEFFLLELGLGLKKKDVLSKKGISFKTNGKFVDKLKKNLPFSLTKAQEKVLNEITKDMQSDFPMNRLLQGDVGSGKTIVSLLAMLKAVENGYQAVLMVPTEILAEQHTKTVKSLLRGIDIKVVLLKSALSPKSKEAVNLQIKNGDADIVIGTHALIEEGVKFKNLGLSVVDEQHRFGVMQRAKLMGKGFNPDVLVMTATPIPRTLAITVYGDLDVSIIDKLPEGRKKIKTYSFKDSDKERNKVYSIVNKELQKGRQGYFIYPFIDESESDEFKHVRFVTKMFEVLKNEVFNDYKVGLLHGRMKSEDKDKVMNMFVSKKLDLLVSTTVVEVGVDVPNATFMVIENAERYGLSQLHQLRGRIGRGEHESICLLLSSWGASEDANKKLGIMTETTDGFKIAEADLSIRGPGEFLGTRQSGIPQFKFANLIRDWRILSEARDEAFAILDKDPKLDNYPEFEDHVKARWGKMLDLQSIS